MDATIDSRKADVFDRLVAVIHERLPGEEATRLATFAKHYFRRSSVADLIDVDVHDLYGMALAHLRAAGMVEPGTTQLRVYNPQVEQHGWRSTHSVVEIVTPDRPFLVDTVTMELTRQGLVIHRILHPIYRVEREDSGRLVAIAPFNPDEPDEGAHESFMHLEVDRQSDSEALQAIETGL